MLTTVKISVSSQTTVSASFHAETECSDIAFFDSLLFSLPFSQRASAQAHSVANVVYQDVSLAGYVLVVSQAHRRFLSVKIRRTRTSQVERKFSRYGRDMSGSKAFATYPPFLQSVVWTCVVIPRERPAELRQLPGPDGNRKCFSNAPVARFCTIFFIYFQFFLLSR